MAATCRRDVSSAMSRATTSASPPRAFRAVAVFDFCGPDQLIYRVTVPNRDSPVYVRTRQIRFRVRRLDDGVLAAVAVPCRVILVPSDGSTVVGGRHAKQKYRVRFATKRHASIAGVARAGLVETPHEPKARCFPGTSFAPIRFYNNSCLGRYYDLRPPVRVR